MRCATLSGVPTYPRYALITDGCTFHITWQCHNHAWLLGSDAAKQLLYDLLLRFKDRYHVAIHSYDLMDNHPHFTGTVEGTKEELSALMRTVNGCFARTINKRMARRGQVVMDRFRSPVIEDATMHLHVMGYGNLNMVRAGMVRHPRQYRWTSYHYYADGRPDPLITPAPAYLALGPTAAARQVAYRAMINALVAHHAQRRHPYSRHPFLGNPQWVAARSAELRRYREAKRTLFQWKQRRTVHALNST